MTPEIRVAIAHARSLLFVPGDRPDRFGKAAGAGADVVILDLEDAVAPAYKAQAREHVRRQLEIDSGMAVRINPPGTEWHDDDVAMLRGRCSAVVLPKAEHPDQVGALAAGLAGGSAIVPLVETAAGVVRAVEVCAVPGVVRAAFGSVDLAAQLGVDPTHREALLPARSSVVMASAATGIAPPIDSPTLDLSTAETAGADAWYASRLGFAGKLCIHPRQVPAINAAFTPSQEALAWARQVVAAAANGSVAVLNGQMIDKPIVDRAMRLLERASRSG